MTSDSVADGYRLVMGTPDADTYRRLRRVAGMSEKSVEAAARGLPNTLFAVTIVANGLAVGMGRVIGDGGCFYQVTDIAVEPRIRAGGLAR